MAIKPILFNTEMVQAILDGRKTCTRRIIKPQPKGRLCYTCAGANNGSWGYPPKTAYEYWGDEYRLPDVITNKELNRRWKAPYDAEDILYVRETWCEYGDLNDSDQIIDGTEKYYYRADGENPTPYNDFLVHRNGFDEHRSFPVWHPSIHMPKEAARIWLKVTNVRVERLQEITEVGIQKEGVEADPKECAGKFDFISELFLLFQRLWDSAIKKSDLDRYGWNANPYVWVIEFERCEKPEEKEASNE